MQTVEFVLDFVKHMQQVHFENLKRLLQKRFVPCIPYLDLIKENISVMSTVLIKAFVKMNHVFKGLGGFAAV